MPLQCGEGMVPSVSSVTSERQGGLRPYFFAEDIQESDESWYPVSSLNPSKASGDRHNKATSYHSKKTSAHYDKRGHGTYAMRAVNVLSEPEDYESDSSQMSTPIFRVTGPVDLGN